MKKIKTSYKGRICRQSGCKNILSIYNHGRYCHLHQDKLVAEGKLKTSRF